MTEQARESLSALMDGEASELDLQRVLRNVGRGEVREAWVRYHGIRGALQRPAEPHAGFDVSSLDVSSRVMAALDLDSEPAPSTSTPRRWKPSRPAVGLAVAASFFLAVILAGRLDYFGGLLPGKSGDAYDGLATAAVESAAPDDPMAEGMGATGALDPSIESFSAGNVADYDSLAAERLRRYIRTHSEAGSVHGPQGMLPYARVASFKEQE